MGFFGSRPLICRMRSTAFFREARQPSPNSVSVG